MIIDNPQTKGQKYIVMFYHIQKAKKLECGN